MGRTRIEWAQFTWNFVDGCAKVSAGCKNCYAERIALKHWRGRAFTDVRVHPEKFDDPVKRRKPTVWFVNSMSDLFHEAVNLDVVARCFAVMAITQRHRYVILTKRPERMRETLSREDFWNHVVRIAGNHSTSSAGEAHERDLLLAASRSDRLLPNVVLGVSVEDQTSADARLPILAATPAAIRLVSYEPALAPVDLVRWMPSLDWVICGAESGDRRRPCDPEWFRAVLRQCYDTPCFVKQVVVGGHLSHEPKEWPADLRVQNYPPTIDVIVNPRPAPSYEDVQTRLW